MRKMRRYEELVRGKNFCTYLFSACLLANREKEEMDRGEDRATLFTLEGMLLPP
jgi:hypothetical protein